MWTIIRSEEYRDRCKKLEKRHCAAFAAVHVNFQTYFEALKGGALVQEISFGFVHHEPMGVKAIDQKGARHAIALRLYIYPDALDQVVYVLTIGDKGTQQEDIKHCKQAVQYIQRNLQCSKQQDSPQSQT